MVFPCERRMFRMFDVTYTHPVVRNTYFVFDTVDI